MRTLTKIIMKSAVAITDGTGISRADLVHIMNELAKADDDFNGNNNDDETDCNWVVTDQNDFECNSDYAIDKVLTGMTDDDRIVDNKNLEVNERISEFLRIWTDDDTYYTGTNYAVEYVNGILFVTIALTTV